MIKQREDGIFVSRRIENRIDWIVAGAFAVIIALMLLNLQVKTPKFTEKTGGKFNSYVIKAEGQRN